MGLGYKRCISTRSICTPRRSQPGGAPEMPKSLFGSCCGVSTHPPRAQLGGLPYWCVCHAQQTTKYLHKAHRSAMEQANACAPHFKLRCRDHAGHFFQAASRKTRRGTDAVDVRLLRGAAALPLRATWHPYVLALAPRCMRSRASGRRRPLPPRRARPRRRLRRARLTAGSAAVRHHSGRRGRGALGPSATRRRTRGSRARKGRPS